MKKSTAFLLFVAGLVTIVASCSSDDDNEVVEEKDGKVFMTFTASQEPFGPVNRTTLDGVNVNWVEGDKIGVWDGTQLNDFTVTPEASDATKAKISGYATKGVTQFVGIYPYDESDEVKEYVITKIVPTFQTPTSGSFDFSAPIMIATSEGLNFEFKNVCSLLKLTTKNNFSKIEVSVESGTLAGTFAVSKTSGEASIFSRGLTINFKHNNGDEIIPGTYYITIIPESSSGLSIKCYNGEEVAVEKKHGDVFEFNRNTIYDMGEFATETHAS